MLLGGLASTIARSYEVHCYRIGKKGDQLPGRPWPWSSQRPLGTLPSGLHGVREAAFYSSAINAVNDIEFNKPVFLHHIGMMRLHTYMDRALASILDLQSSWQFMSETD